MTLDNSKVGRAVVRCHGCGEERWYGYGACSVCRSFLPGAGPARDRVHPNVYGCGCRVGCTCDHCPNPPESVAPTRQETASHSDEQERVRRG